MMHWPDRFFEPRPRRNICAEAQATLSQLCLKVYIVEVRCDLSCRVLIVVGVIVYATPSSFKFNNIFEWPKRVVMFLLALEKHRNQSSNVKAIIRRAKQRIISTGVSHGL